MRFFISATLKRNLIVENAKVISVKESGSLSERNSTRRPAMKSIEPEDDLWWGKSDGQKRFKWRQNQVGRNLEGKVISIEKKSSAGEQKGEIRCKQRNSIPIKTWKRPARPRPGAVRHGFCRLGCKPRSNTLDEPSDKY